MFAGVSAGPVDFKTSVASPFRAAFHSLLSVFLSPHLASKFWSRQAPRFRSLQISGLLADFSSGWMVSLPTRRKSPTRDCHSAVSEWCRSFCVLDLTHYVLCGRLTGRVFMLNIWRPTAGLDSVTFSGSVSSKIAATMSGASVSDW